MSDPESPMPAEEPAEPIVLPENSHASPGAAQAQPAATGAPPDEPPTPGRRPRVWTVWLVFVLSQTVNLAVVTVLLVLIALWQYGADVLSTRGGDLVLEASRGVVGLLGTVSATMIVFAASALAAAALSPVPWRRRLRLRAARISALGLLVHIVGVLGIGLVFSALLELDVLPESPSLTELTEIMRGLSGGSLWGAVVVLGIAPGIAEELLFRGYIQTRFARRWGPGWGVLWTALLFGVMHLDRVHGLFAFALGIYLGYLTEWSGSIVPAVVCHAANNSVSTLTTAWGFDIVGTQANLVALAVGGVVLALALWHLNASVKPNRKGPSWERYALEESRDDERRPGER